MRTRMEKFVPDEIITAAATMGRKGGASKSPAKTAAVRENGRKGGRPRKVSINPSDITRHGITILLGQGRTATQGMDGNLPTLVIRDNGRKIKTYRGSSLYFSQKLTKDDKAYLASLGSTE